MGVSTSKQCIVITPSCTAHHDVLEVLHVHAVAPRRAFRAFHPLPKPLCFIRGFAQRVVPQPQRLGRMVGRKEWGRGGGYVVKKVVVVVMMMVVAAVIELPRQIGHKVKCRRVTEERFIESALFFIAFCYLLELEHLGLAGPDRGLHLCFTSCLGCGNGHDLALAVPARLHLRPQLLHFERHLLGSVCARKEEDGGGTKEIRAHKTA